MKPDPGIELCPLVYVPTRFQHYSMRDARPDMDDEQSVVLIRYGIFFVVGAFLWGLDGGVGMIVIYMIFRVLFS